MSEVRWRPGFSPPALVLSGILVLAVSGLVVGRTGQGPGAAKTAACAAGAVAADLAQPWVPAGRSPMGAAPVSGLDTAAADAGAANQDAVWWSRSERAAEDGALKGYRLRLGPLGGAAGTVIDLPPESFAAGPFGDLVLYGSDDGRRSIARVARASDGCDRPLLESREIIRSATLDPAGRLVYLHLLERTTRRDLGIWRLGIDGGMPVPILEAFGPDRPGGPYGRTFSTQLEWTQAGGRLVAQWCGELMCRAKVHDPLTMEETALEAPRVGQMIGASGDALYAYGACPGFPCSVRRVDLATGAVATVIPSAGTARLIGSGPGEAVVFEDPAPGVNLARWEAASGRTSRIGTTDGQLQLLAVAARSGIAVTTGRGWSLLADPSAPPSDPLRGSRLVRAADGEHVDIREVTR